MKIGFYPRYDRLGASSRHRFFAYFERWQKANAAQAGVNCASFCKSCPSFGLCTKQEELAIHPGFSNCYLKQLYRVGHVSSFRKFREFLHCWARLVILEDQLVIEYELLPGVPWKLEKFFLGKRKYVLNFDDNVWEKYAGNPKLNDKFDQLCAHASGIIVANRFLYEKVRPLNANICQIPTVVDLEAYQKTALPKFDRFTVVWIGTPVTYAYLESHAECLRAMSEAVNFELLVVAKESLKSRAIPGLRMRFQEWSEAGESEALSRSHVGIMPLASDAFSQGKSAFKLIQYQAAGLPAIASPVGENCRVIEPGKNGFLAETPAEWAEALKKLHDQPEIYATMAQRARQSAESYSIQKYFPIYQEFIRQSFR